MTVSKDSGFQITLCLYECLEVRPENPCHGRERLVSGSQYKDLDIHKCLKSCPDLQLIYALLSSRVKDPLHAIFISISEKSPLQLPTQNIKWD